MTDNSYPAGDVGDLIKVQDQTATARNRRTGELLELAGLPLTITEAAPNGVVRAQLRNDILEIDTYLTRRQYEVMVDVSEVAKSAETSIKRYLAEGAEYERQKKTRKRRWTVTAVILAMLGLIWLASRARAQDCYAQRFVEKPDLNDAARTAAQLREGPTVLTWATEGDGGIRAAN